MSQIKSVRERAEIIENRISHTEFGEILEWENLSIFDQFELGEGHIIVVSGNEDLAHSIHSDLSNCKTINSPFGTENRFQIIISPHELP